VTGGDASLQRDIVATLDGLLAALEFDAAGADRFRARCEPARFDRVFGGQLLAQALLAAAATVAGQEPDSLHAYFTGAGTPGPAVDLVVDRVRSGRSISVRRVTVSQEERPILDAIVSFRADAIGPEQADPPPAAPAPEAMPLLQHWVGAAPAELRAGARRWVDRPPPLELRIGEPPYFLGGSSAGGTRSHWMRLPHDVGDGRLLHAALLTYASDYFLLDMAFRSYPRPVPPADFIGLSLDHAIWIHRPVHFDRWHLHTQQAVAISGDRGLVRGSIHDTDGHLVASVMQEVLVRTTASEP
jgi:acyl-CoA thioesterase-2